MIALFQMTVTIKSSGDEAQRLKAFMHNIGKDHIRKQLQEYIRSLREEFSKGLILPKKGENSKADNVSTITSGFNKKINMEPVIAPKENKIGCKLDTKTIELTEKFQCRAQEFYDAMTRIEMVTAFTQVTWNVIDLSKQSQCWAKASSKLSILLNLYYYI